MASALTSDLFPIPGSGQVKGPTPSIPSGKIVDIGSRILLNSETPGAKIYYTTNGSAPTTKSPNGSSVAIMGTPGGTFTIKAMAVKEGMQPSPIGSYSYRLSDIVAPPTIDSASGSTFFIGGSVSLNTITPGASIHYTTDGTKPTVNSPSGNRIELNGSPGKSITIRAFAVGSGMVPSSERTFNISLSNVLIAPTTKTLTGSTVPIGSKIDLFSPITDTTFHYTTNGLTPTVNSPTGRSVMIMGSPGSQVTVKAIAVKNGMNPSAVSTFTYTLSDRVAPPTADVASGSAVDLGDRIHLSSFTDPWLPSGKKVYYKFKILGTSIERKIVNSTLIIPSEFKNTPSITFQVTAYSDYENQFQQKLLKPSEAVTFMYKIRTPAPFALPSSTSAIENGGKVNLWIYPGEDKTIENMQAQYFYTMDGSTPTTISPSGRVVTVIGTPGSRVTIKAISIRDGFDPSKVVTLEYTMAGERANVPYADIPDEQTVANNSFVKLKSDTSGATIYYTLDGSAPTTDSQSITNDGSVKISGAPGAKVIVKAVVVKEGMVASAVSTFSYTIQSKKAQSGLIPVTGSSITLIVDGKSYDLSTGEKYYVFLVPATDVPSSILAPGSLP
jgi:hypothetical protein